MKARQKAINRKRQLRIYKNSVERAKAEIRNLKNYIAYLEGRKDWYESQYLRLLRDKQERRSMEVRLAEIMNSLLTPEQRDLVNEMVEAQAEANGYQIIRKLSESGLTTLLTSRRFKGVK